MVCVLRFMWHRPLNLFIFDLDDHLFLSSFVSTNPVSILYCRLVGAKPNNKRWQLKEIKSGEREREMDEKNRNADEIKKQKIKTQHTPVIYR